ncbi:LysR family transcriptional regulator [Bordetella genomosp. 11]|nr:LysR family transcriptional regulator [Bordetella genomosp. 11]
MKLIWLEDFLALLQAGTFSRAAAMRNITQPAFSRRIQMLEDWLGVRLIDRGSAGLRLTPLGERYTHEFRALLMQATELRNRIQSEHHGVRRALVAAQHTLTITWLPGLLRLVQREAPGVELGVDSQDRGESIARFASGEAQLLLCLEADTPLQASMPHTARLDLGHERLIAVSAATAAGAPVHRPHARRSVRLLGYPAHSFMGTILYKHCLPPLMDRYEVRIVQESGFVAGIKEMALAGMGMAWLPERLIARELAIKALVMVGPELPRVEVPVSLYRAGRVPEHGVVDEIWALLQAHYPPAEPREDG